MRAFPIVEGKVKSMEFRTLYSIELRIMFVSSVIGNVVAIAQVPDWERPRYRLAILLSAK